MASQINPKTWLSMDLNNPKQWNVFMNQLVRYLTDNVSNIGSASSINGSSLVLTTKALGSVSTNQTVACANACDVTVSLTITAGLTLTLTNLQVGIPVVIKASSTGSFTLKFAATTPSGTAYAITGISTAGASFNLVTTGANLTSSISVVLVGNSVIESGPTPTLYLGIVG